MIQNKARIFHIAFGVREQRIEPFGQHDGFFRLQPRAGNPGQGTDLSGIGEIFPHKLFNRLFNRAGGITHLARENDLSIKGQGLNRTARVKMKMNTGPPQEICGADKAGCRVLIKQTQFDIVLRPVSVINAAVLIQKSGDPVEHMQVAQSAFAFFNIGFDHIAGIAFAVMTNIALFEFGCDIGPALAFGDIFAKPGIKVLGQVQITANKAQVEQGR